MSGTDTGPPAPLGPGTLGRQLVLRVAALVGLVALLLSLATTVAVRQLLLNDVDESLSAVTERLRGAPGMDGPRAGLNLRGLPLDTVIAVFSADQSPLDSARQIERGRQPELNMAVLDRLSRLEPTRRERSMQLPGLGSYRVVAYPATIQSGDLTTEAGTVVVGVPLAQVNRTLLLVVLVELALSLLALAGSALASRAVVLRSLRPLNRVAATAAQVSTLPLDRGEVALAVRVPPEDADPRSEVGRVGQAINRMLANVSGALEARHASELKLRQFVADASHELRNPLAAILGYAELTRRRRDELPPDTAYAMARVEAEAARMSALVQDLLLLARLDSGPDLDLQPVDLTELVLNAVSDARAAGPDHAWTLVLPEEPVTARGDLHRLHQVLTNLLANARTHTPPGTRVETAVGVEGGRALVTVTDNGPGIPPEIRASVFERFTRAEVSRARAEGNERSGSTGLGLAIVAAVVEAHRGSVEVQSAPGRTRFAVRLPLA